MLLYCCLEHAQNPQSPTKLRTTSASRWWHCRRSLVKSTTKMATVHHRKMATGKSVKYWWMKPVNNGIFTISTGAGFLPSTVLWNTFTTRRFCSHFSSHRVFFSKILVMQFFVFSSFPAAVSTTWSQRGSPPQQYRRTSVSQWGPCWGSKGQKTLPPQKKIVFKGRFCVPPKNESFLRKKNMP